MRTSRHALLVTVIASFARVSSAQSGTLDQVSPFQPVGAGQVFDAESPGTTWQAQVRAGLTGRLEGFTLELNSTQGAGTLLVRLRPGAGWNTGAIVFQATISAPSTGVHDVFVDTTSAAIQLTTGDLFVIEMQGTNTGIYLNGSYVDPVFGAPAYAEPLFQNGPGCYFDCGSRIGFKTYVLEGSPSSAFCSGDGTATACPCANSGSAGRGCGNSTFPGGAHLSASGFAGASAGTDTLSLTASDISGPGLFIQGAGQSGTGSGIPFGDGLLCVGGALMRLGVVFPTSGSASYPGGSTPTPIHAAGGTVAGDVRHYQCWYRDAASFCAPSTFNLTQGLTLTWGS